MRLAAACEECRRMFSEAWPAVVMLSVSPIHSWLMSQVPQISCALNFFLNAWPEHVTNKEINVQTLCLHRGKSNYCLILELWVWKFPAGKFLEIYSRLSGNLVQNFFTLYCLIITNNSPNLCVSTLCIMFRKKITSF